MATFGGPHPIITDGLKQSYDFASLKCYNNGLTSVSDLITSTACNITNTGNAISYADGCLTWDGVGNAYIDIPDIAAETMPLFSLEAWVYNQSGGASRHSLLRNFWEIVGTSVQFWSYSFADEYWRSSGSGAVPYDTWTHITTTWDGSVIRHYINGELYWTDSSSSSGTHQLFHRIGGYGGREFKGKLAVLSIYEKTLSAEEISQNYNSKKARFGL